MKVGFKAVITAYRLINGSTLGGKVRGKSLGEKSGGSPDPT